MVGKLDKGHLSMGSFKSRTCERGIQDRYLFGGHPRERNERMLEVRKKPLKGMWLRPLLWTRGSAPLRHLRRGRSAPRLICADDGKLGHPSGPPLVGSFPGNVNSPSASVLRRLWWEKALRRKSREVRWVLSEECCY